MKIDRLIKALKEEIPFLQNGVDHFTRALMADSHAALTDGDGDFNIGRFAHLREATMLLFDLERDQSRNTTSAMLDEMLNIRMSIVQTPNKPKLAQILDDARMAFYQKMLHKFKGIQTLEDLEGDTILRVTGLYKESSEVLFFFEAGVLRMMHPGVCCSEGLLEDFEGNAEDFIGRPLTKIEVSSNPASEKNNGNKEYDWTFYKLRSDKGYLDLRWLGNTGRTGMYSSAIDCHWFPAETAQLVVDIWRPKQEREAIVAALNPLRSIGLNTKVLTDKSLRITFPLSLLPAIKDRLKPWPASMVQWHRISVAGDCRILT